MQWNYNMRNLVMLFVCLIVVSCQKEEVFLAQSNVSIVSEVVDHSPVYVFFETKKNDTLVSVNRKNTISTTNWLFNIDKRLPLRLVVPEIIKLQEKREKAVFHKNDKAQNFITYNDTLKKTLAFIPFTKVKFFMGKPTAAHQILVTKGGEISIDTQVFENVQAAIIDLKSKKATELSLYQLGIEKNATLTELLSTMVGFKVVGFEDIYNNVYIY